MPSPMERKEQQVGMCTNLVEKVFLKMSAHDKRIFVRALGSALALKMSPPDRDEWIEKMQKNLQDNETP